jgi:hypothetical protein
MAWRAPLEVAHDVVGQGLSTIPPVVGCLGSAKKNTMGTADLDVFMECPSMEGGRKIRGVIVGVTSRAHLALPSPPMVGGESPAGGSHHGPQRKI